MGEREGGLVGRGSSVCEPERPERRQQPEQPQELALGQAEAEPSPTRVADAALLAAVAQGDEAAFQVLFESKHRHVYLVAYQIVGNAATAEEVLQETFLALWKSASTYRTDFAVDTWLTRIATNKAIDRWRSGRTEARRRVPLRDASDENAGPAAVTLEAVPAPSESSDVSLPARSAEVQAVWDDLADGLPPQQRAAFALRIIEGIDAREVAEILGCSLSTVRSHVALARKTLRKGIAERYPEYLRKFGTQPSNDNVGAAR